tara:strand:+ start:1491 stop:1727 length:237 start_codon:yes stop_codon:yes gene_type:complete
MGTQYIYLGKERKYKKMSKESIKEANRLSKGPKPVYAEEYRGLSWQERVKKAALNASDNGRCWWIYDHIMRSTLQRHL